MDISGYKYFNNVLNNACQKHVQWTVRCEHNLFQETARSSSCSKFIHLKGCKLNQSVPDIKKLTEYNVHYIENDNIIECFIYNGTVHIRIFYNII